LKSIPAKTTLIGRIRCDAFLHNQPEQQSEKGRNKRYGDRVIRPEELRTDPSVEWQTVSVYATGKLYAFRIKTENLLLCRKAGHTMPLRLVVIAPLLYRRIKQGERLYRKPAKMHRITTNQLRNYMRDDLWVNALPPPSVLFSDFMLKT
jgi:hypothetical protein